MKKPEKFSVPVDILNAIALYLQKQPWEDVNPLLVAIQGESNELQRCDDNTWKEIVKQDIIDRTNPVPEKQPDQPSDKPCKKTK